MTRPHAFLSCLAASALLSACGGGGSDSSAASTAAAASSSDGSTVSNGSTSTYAANSAQASAFQRLNAARTQCGFGALSQAVELDVAAAAHAKYMSANNAYGHIETQGLPGFTGAAPPDRATAAGYRWGFSGEALAQVNSSDTGADAVRGLLAAPYHAALLLNGFRDAGIGWSPVGGLPVLTLDLGTRLGQSNPSVSGVATYPCSGINDAVPVAGAESPSPFPANASARWGQPVTVRGPADLRLNSVSITGPLGSVQLQAVYGDGQQADPNTTGDFTQGFFAIIPATLQANTTYSVNIAYTTGGTAGTRNFSFTTASR
ncbi:MAG TPA: CAP domain-containing protein [Ramlibacter sp.]|nr:CAP domain-containing protein [Ramlibacter sp.]